MARPRSFDEADVLAQARDTFWTRGYAATSVDDLSAATGLGKGSLYGAFGDKHALFLRALDGYAGWAIDTVRAQLRDPELSPGERLARHLRAQAGAIAADRSRRGCMLAKSAAELGATDEAADKAIARAYTSWRAELVDCIDAAQRVGEVDPQRDAQALATTLLAFLRGLEALHQGGARPAQLRAAADEMVALITPE